MEDKYNIERFLGKKGFSGPLFAVDNRTGTPMIDESDNSHLYIENKLGLVDGFYSVRASVDDVKFTAKIVISAYAPARNLNRKGKLGFLLYPNSPLYTINYTVDNSDQNTDILGNIVTPGTFDTYFAKSVVKVSGSCEQWSAINLVLGMNGTSKFQENFPVDFTQLMPDNTTRYFVADSVTKNNIDNVNSYNT